MWFLRFTNPIRGKYLISRYLQTERNAYKVLKTHPNITRTFPGEMSQIPVIIMEKGTLLERILQKLTQGLNEPQVLKILKDLAKAISYCHSQGVVHRDIRPENIIYGSDGKFKLQNFQRATFQVSTFAHYFQLYNKVAPEIKSQIRDEIDANVHSSIKAPEQIDLNLGFALNEKVDVYAVGCLVYQIIYNRRYDSTAPLFTMNSEWQQYSDKLYYLIRQLLSPNPKDRPSGYQIEQYLETFSASLNSSMSSNAPNPYNGESSEPQSITQSPQGPVHVRSKSQNSQALIAEQAKKTDDLKERFSGLDCIEVKQGPENKSSIYIQMIKYISRFSNKTEGWVMACVEENEEGPKQKYVRLLIVKAWNKKDKIGKFYSTLHAKSVKSLLDSTLVMMKSLILMHNYFKKGPPEAMIYSQKEVSPMDQLKKINLHWKTVSDGLSNQKLTLNSTKSEQKDRFRSVYMAQLITDFAALLLEKLRICIYYNNYFEGNFSLNPFFNSMLKSFKPLTLGLVENLLRYWDKCIQFSQTLFKENNLVKIQFSLGLSMIDETYCLLSLLCHLLFAFKHSTNYIEGTPQTSNLRGKQSYQYLEQKRQVLQKISSRGITPRRHNSSTNVATPNMVPTLPLSLLDTIKSVPVLQQTKGDFNIFDYLNYGKSLEGIKIPLSYGEAVGNIKIENEELISLSVNEEKYRTNTVPDENIKGIGISQTSRDNRFTNQQRSIDSPLDTVKKPPQSAKVGYPLQEPGFNKTDIEKMNNKQTVQQPFEQFNIYNEFSHQTYSQDFNIHVQQGLKEQQEQQKNLKLFDFDQSARSSISKPLESEPILKGLVKGPSKEEEPRLQSKNEEAKKKSVQDLSKKQAPKKQTTSGYQDLSFSEDEIEDGPDLNQTKPIQAMEIQHQKTTINRAIMEKDDFLALPDSGQKPTVRHQQQQSSNFVADFSNMANQKTNPFNEFANNPFGPISAQRKDIPPSNNIFQQFNFIPNNAPVTSAVSTPNTSNRQLSPFSKSLPMVQPQPPQQPQVQRLPSQQFINNMNPNVAPFVQNNYYQPQQITGPGRQFSQQQTPQPHQQQLTQQQQNPVHIPYQTPQLQQFPQQQTNPFFVPSPQPDKPRAPSPIQLVPTNPQPTQAFELYRFITHELNTNANDWIINLSQLTLEKQIGTGSSCDVYKGYWRGNEVAVKKMKIKSLTENHMKEFRREITALVKIKPHKHLVSLIGISQKVPFTQKWFQEDELYIVTEYCAGGTLFDLLHRQKKITMPWVVRIRVGYQIAQGMSYLHDLSPPIIHRDLKSLNLLLENVYDKDNLQRIVVKIADFGLARTQQDNGEQMTGVLGTFVIMFICIGQHWMAPEIFESKPYSIRADVYSFGIVLWEICSRETPYKSFSTPHAIMKFVTFDKGRPDLNLIQDGCPITLRDLMIRCWDHDPLKRPTFNEAVSILRSIL